MDYEFDLAMPTAGLLRTRRGKRLAQLILLIVSGEMAHLSMGSLNSPIGNKRPVVFMTMSLFFLHTMVNYTFFGRGVFHGKSINSDPVYTVSKTCKY